MQYILNKKQEARMSIIKVETKCLYMHIRYVLQEKYKNENSYKKHKHKHLSLYFLVIYAINFKHAVT